MNENGGVNRAGVKQECWRISMLLLLLVISMGYSYEKVGRDSLLGGRNFKPIR